MMQTPKTRTLCAAACGALLALSAGFSAAEDYPVRPIRIIVGFAPGGAFLPWMMSSSLATRFMAAATFAMSVYVRPARRDIKCRAGAACAFKLPAPPASPLISVS